MKASDKLIYEVIGRKTISFKIPPYQRKFKWTFKGEVSTLLDDLEEFIKTERMDYFLGSIVIKTTKGMNQDYILVDGQQRITTFLIIVAALKEVLKNSNSKVKERLEMILETDENKFKLNRIKDQRIVSDILNNNIYHFNDEDKNSYYYIVFNKLVEYFKKKDIDECESFYHNGLVKIKIAVIDLDDSEDEFLVFESINSKGKSLTSSDLIKNYIMMNATEELSDYYEKEIMTFFSDEEFSDFYRQLIAIKTGALVSKTSKQMYYKFKDLFKPEDINQDFMDYIYKNSLIWKYIRESNFGNESLPFLKGGLLNFYAILHVVVDKNSKIMDKKLNINDENLIKYVVLKLSAILIRRALQGSGRVESNRKFASMANKLNDTIADQKIFDEEIINGLKNNQTNAKIIKDEDILKKIDTIDLYTSHKTTLKWVLIAWEQIKAKKEIDTKNITVEHIFPQNPSSEWEVTEELQNLTNTLGNLSITNDNSSLGNKLFEDKKMILENRSYLKINKYIYEREEWTAEDVKKRGKNIFEEIIKIWPL